MEKELIENLRFKNRIINDIAFTYKLVLNSDNIAFSNQVKYYYYKHENSISNQKKKILIEV